MSTIILTCTCQSNYQDKAYGKNQRAFNSIKKGYRCTTCGKITPVVRNNKKNIH